FIPVAFTPGVTGQLYKQFALTVASAVGISGINALTLSPALCAIFLRKGSPTGPRRGFGWFNCGFERLSRQYEQGVGRLIQHRLVVLLVFIVLLGITYYLFQIVPTGFVPDEDQGYFVVIVQLPEGASQERTTRVSNEIEQILMATPGVTSTLNISSTANSADVFPILAPWSERTAPDLHVDAIMQDVRERLASIEEADVYVVNPPPIQGLGSTGGFQFELQDIQGGNLEALARQAEELVQKGNERPELSRLYTLFRLNTPELFVDLDRTKTMTQNVQISDVFETLQAYLGSLYVNDFNKFGRVYRVYIQAESDARSDISDISRLYVNNANNDKVPLSTLLRVKQVTAPASIDHYNTYRSISITGEAGPGYSSGEAIAAMEQLANETLPSTMSFAWTGISYQQIEAGHLAPFLFALSLVLVFLFLAAQYESWRAPFVIMLAVPLAMLGALGAQLVRGLENDLYCQVGLLILIGLASKNAILIVEFARRNRAAGLAYEAAAIKAARVRLRPILMTAFAFILGVFPLVIASGAGAASRHSLGTAVFGGMIVATFLTLLIVPVLFVLVERFNQRRSG
ncbi:MAG: efflux RND transporter permease subunit, partial [Pseudomonadota bacterium]